MVPHIAHFASVITTGMGRCVGLMDKHWQFGAMERMMNGSSQQYGSLMFVRARKQVGLLDLKRGH